MRTLLHFAIGLVLVVGILETTCASPAGTAFTYQGRLNDGPGPATGSYDLRFAVFDAASDGALVAGPVTHAAVTISNGLFTIRLDFGPGVFTGEARWLEVGARTNGAGTFTGVLPRQVISPTPYAISADHLSGLLSATQLSGVLPSNALAGTYSGAVTFNNATNRFAGTFTGQALGLSGVDAAMVGGLTAANFWQLGGNAGTAPAHFLGTTDNQAMEIRVNGARALRLEPASDSPNVIGGAASNGVSLGVLGATIAGGGNASGGQRISASYGAIGGGYQNFVNGFAATVAGGSLNQALQPAAVVGGGSVNTNSGESAVIGGGRGNFTTGFYSVIAGGILNVSTSAWSSLGGGQENMTLADHAVIGGGRENRALGAASAIGGGRLNRARSDFAAVAGGFNNEAARFSSVGGGQGNSATGDSATIAGGSGNRILTNAATIGGGADNEVRGVLAVIAGGFRNRVDANQGTVAGGQELSISNSSDFAMIGGGFRNTIFTNAPYASIVGGTGNSILSNASYATIAGGRGNCAAGSSSFAAGYVAEALHDNTFVWSDGRLASFASTSPYQFLVHAAGGVGLNTTTPSGQLDVRSESGESATVHVGGAGANGSAKLVSFGDGPYVSIGENHADDQMELTASAFVFTTASFAPGAGKVGLGRVPVVNRLEVEGEASKTTAGGWLANSDRRIKRDVETITNALDRLGRVRLVHFRYTDEYRAAHPQIDDQAYLNVVAQEFQAVFPEHVKASGEKLQDGSDILQVDTYPLTIYAAAAIQELHRRVLQKDGCIASLERKSTSLERRLAELEAREAARDARLAALEHAMEARTLVSGAGLEGAR